MTPEGKVKQLVRTALKGLGAECWFFWPVSNGMGVHGVPDCLGCYRGKFFAIEVKAPGRRGQANHGCSGLQVRQIQAITAAGGIVDVVDDADSLAAFIETLTAP